MNCVDTMAGVAPHRLRNATKAPTAICIAVGVASAFAKHVRPTFGRYPSLAFVFQHAESTLHPAPMPAQA